MKIGLEPDPVEDMEREIEIAIAAAAKAQFGGQGDIGKALAEVHRLAHQRLAWTNGNVRLRA